MSSKYKHKPFLFECIYSNLKDLGLFQKHTAEINKFNINVDGYRESELCQEREMGEKIHYILKITI